MDLLRDTAFDVAFVVTPLKPPRPTLTVVVKATFALPLEGVCAIAPEQLPVSGDAHDDDDPTKPLRAESDLAPMKPRGECFVLGRCHPPGGAAAHSGVAFAIGPVKKRIAVFGDRAWGAWPLRAPGAPAVFASMPLGWERACGGADDPRNPIGRGGADAQMPNLEDPDALVTRPDARPTPAGCGPIARTWAARAGLAGTYDGAWQRDRWPFLPDDHDLAYHLAAPPDQRIEGYWSGDEEIVLRNLHPERDLVRVRLPGLTARVFAVRHAGGDPEAVRMRLDTITVDAEAKRVIALWRGHLDVASDRLEDLHGLVVWHEPLAAGSGVAEARARLDAARAKVAADDAGFALEAIPDDATTPDDDPPEAPLDPDAVKALDDLEALAAANATPEPEASDEAVRAAVDASVEAAAKIGITPPKPDDDEPVTVEATPRERLLAAIAAGADTTGLDLTEADLTGLDLAGRDLSRCVLTRAVLTDAVLDGATLARATLAGATLTRASLTRANLTRADLTGARGEAVSLREATLTSAVLTGVDLRGAVMRGCVMTSAEARDATLDGADLRGATLDGADLSGARLAGASLAGASLVGASLEGARAAGVDLTGADVTKLRASEGAVLTGASLREAKGPQAIFCDAILDGADLSYGDFTRAEFSGARLNGAALDGCALRGARALGAVFTGARALRADAMEINLEGADLGDADLRGANLYGAQLWKARVRGARFDGALLGGTLLAKHAATLGAR